MGNVMPPCEPETATEMSLLQIAYVSQSLLSPDYAQSNAELRRIFQSAQRFNVLLGITGYFVFDGNRFAQILEGEAPSVRGTALRIFADYRHANVRVLGERHIAKREFKPWVMGFSDLRKLQLNGKNQQNFDEVRHLLTEAARRSLGA
jgi:Sensors of blue-light using FAD